MKAELEHKLYEKYPEMLTNRHLSPQESNMCWGFECGDGWYNILYLLMGTIQSHVNWQNRFNVTVTPVTLDQVKEKFGGLRFYYTGGDGVVDGMVRMAEAMSYRTCEVCGNPGRQRGRSWIYVACEEHTKEEHRDKA